ncbi:hypothetical protein OG604_25325 [Streptomyces sp. NBC_01231]|nr:hypothetical protein OG604_25325 [Streptomyces sp. NBC_01231]
MRPPDRRRRLGPEQPPDRHLIKTLDGLGEPWGHDEQGDKFGNAYKPQQKKIESGAGVLVLGLTSRDAHRSRGRPLRIRL